MPIVAALIRFVLNRLPPRSRKVGALVVVIACGLVGLAIARDLLIDASKRNSPTDNPFWLILLIAALTVVIVVYALVLALRNLSRPGDEV